MNVSDAEPGSTCCTRLWDRSDPKVSREVSCDKPAVVRIDNYMGRSEWLCQEHAAEVAVEIQTMLLESRLAK